MAVKTEFKRKERCKKIGKKRKNKKMKLQSKAKSRIKKREEKETHHFFKREKRNYLVGFNYNVIVKLLGKEVRNRCQDPT